MTTPRKPAPTVAPPPILAVIKPSHGYQIHAACRGVGCGDCQGMGEVAAVAALVPSAASAKPRPALRRSAATSPAAAIAAAIVAQSKRKQ